MVTQTLRNMFGTGEPNLVSSQEGANGLVKDMGSRMIVGLDIGTTKVVAVVGQLKGNGLEVIGIGSCPSRGLKKGVVVDIESTVQSIQRAVEEAELMAGCQIHSVYVGIAGNHIRSLNSHISYNLLGSILIFYIFFSGLSSKLIKDGRSNPHI